jgi:hypothetical protein
MRTNPGTLGAPLNSRHRSEAIVSVEISAIAQPRPLPSPSRGQLISCDKVAYSIEQDIERSIPHPSKDICSGPLPAESGGFLPLGVCGDSRPFKSRMSIGTVLG